MNSVRSALNVVIAIALLAFISLNLIRLMIFFLQTQNLL